ncbi:hypothetical protein SPRG_06332 [Saprolegnia parasitica CBS 223.65]|uniref:Tyrosine-protein phosphatase domain-containing protein n=1 Tax=Saprolegnia parasitica (strain CBS 223.65) TaxID=695850 RepID=A0A067CP33_SAPPC|nr:hypothetical protein SPRG_06332 [Saprolegnia parasitica CBS 223.65]KDO28281.1 hypothetical protein SPRG_06332 [Saprolegnia parasitica CBS 223.65]|eukprot:XP_012201101.1 hypothetical protein SPRG_06332 [Saprolegnia parasitica CBS 223.65]
MSTKINNGLFMGDVDAAQDADFLSLNGIEFVINCVPREMPNVFEADGVQYLALDMAEDPSGRGLLFDLRCQEFLDVVDFLESAMEESQSVLVHSMDGISRSPSVMMSYLMVKYQWSLDKAFEYVKMKRGDINVHPAYIEQLSSLDSQLQSKFAGRISRQKRSEWDPRHTDPNTDEIVLVNTFLNVASTAGAVDDDDRERRDLAAKTKKSLVWLDSCPRLRKMHPEYDFTKLERPPSASYSALVAGNGWVDTLEPARRRGVESRPIQDVDLSLTDDDDESEPAKPAADSWDISYSDPGVGHDADAKQYDTDDDGRKPRHGSIPSHHIMASKAVAKRDEGNQQHSPTEAPSSSSSGVPRYLQHTKSSRNAKLLVKPPLPRRGSNKPDQLGDFLERVKLDEDASRSSTTKPRPTKTKVPPRPRTSPVSTKPTTAKASLVQNVIRGKSSSNAVNPAIHVTPAKPRRSAPTPPVVYGWAEKKQVPTKKPDVVKPPSVRQASNRVTPAKWR